MTGKSEKDMVIYLAGESQTSEPEPLPSFDELTPREIVIELDNTSSARMPPKKRSPSRSATAFAAKN
jgi:hypothetical protein